MRLLVFAGATVFVVWLVAVVGAALLGHAVDRRTAAYADHVPASTWDRPLIAWVVQLLRALRRPALWRSGLFYGLRLLVGIDDVEAMSEHEVRGLVEASRNRLRLEAWRASHAEVEEEADDEPLDEEGDDDEEEDDR